MNRPSSSPAPARRLRWQPFLVVGLLIEAASIAMTILSGEAVHRSAEERAALLFERQVERGMVAARERLEKYEQGLLSGAALFNASGQVSRSEWREYVDRLEPERWFPGISGLGFIRRLPPGTVDDWVAEVRATSAPEFEVTVLDSPDPAHRYVIDYIEPLAPNLPARGLDIGSEENRRAAATESMRTGETRITNIITLVQDDARKPGFLMLVPVYTGGGIPRTEAERVERCIGWSYAPFVGEITMRGIADIVGAGVGFSIYDGDRAADRRIFDGVGGLAGGRETERIVDVGGKQWRFVWAKHDAVSIFQDDSWWMVLLGLLFSTGLLVIMFLLHRSHGRALRIAEQASRSKSDFLAVMSHEVRTPLHGIVGMTEILLEDDLPPKSRERAESIRSSGHALVRLVNDVLDFSKLDHGSMLLEDEPFDPGHEAKAAAEPFRGGMRRAGVDLELELPPVGAERRRGDGLRFRQIVQNLVGNAAKFTESGTVTVRVETEADALRLVVADTGIGMDERTVARLFRPFEQAERSTTRRFGGTGLGLSIVKQLVDAMHGDIRVDTALGAGTRFTVTLPLAPVDAPTAAEAAIDEVPDALDLYVLMADDNPVNLRIGRAFLENLRCEVDTVGDGEAAVEAAVAAPYDVVLMDWKMPGIDGLEATRRLRALGVDVPVVAASANASASDRRACREAGMQGFVGKPFGREALVRELLRVTADAPETIEAAVGPLADA